ncbi:unnamed protein product [Didymodactylos carnosus]|uniref:Uncharacterized protein n=1 Tax=Didymodactylos carnosus TaxID=1234261 RepID=A0A815BSE1_9BILA|nr:unnamed protein product [Didymodactylos carnosus]CAF4069148.1 unnamed protein product [Didymodactylos carnosus]
MLRNQRRWLITVVYLSYLSIVDRFQAHSLTTNVPPSNSPADSFMDKIENINFLFVDDDNSSNNGSNQVMIIRNRRDTLSLSLTDWAKTDDKQLIHQSEIDMPWQKFIVSGPVGVNLLGQLMVLSTKLDFSFRDSAPNYTYRYVRHPNSFRATLVQIANDGWKAFLQAHTNMNKIQLYMQLIPGHVNTSLKLLMFPSTRLLERLLPKTLNTIEHIGKACVQLAIATEAKFKNTLDLLGEVIELTERSRGVKTQKLKQTQIEYNLTLIEKEDANKLAEQIRKRYNEARETVKIAQDEYRKALREIPTGMMAFFRDLGGEVVYLVNSIGDLISSSNKNRQGVSYSATPRVESSLATKQAFIIVKPFADSLDKLIQKVNIIFQKPADKKQKSISKSSNNNNTSDELSVFKIAFKMFFNRLQSGKSNDIKVKAINIFRNVIQLTDDIIKEWKAFTFGEKVDQNVISKIQSRLDEATKELRPLVTASELNSDGGTSRRPNHIDVGSGVNSNINNEKIKAQLAQNRLYRAEQRYDAMFLQLKEQEQEMTKIMMRIASLDLTIVDYKQVLELLRDAMGLLANIKEQWSNMALFFAGISTRAQIALNGTLVPFLNIARDTHSTILEYRDFTREERAFCIEQLKQEAIGILNEASLLYIMSKTYVDVSSQHLMQRLAGLSKLLTAKDDHERNQLNNQLSIDTKLTQQHVTHLAIKRRQAYHDAVIKRQTELTQIIDSLGGSSETDIKVISDGEKILDTLEVNDEVQPDSVDFSL